MDDPIYYGNSMRSVFNTGERLQLKEIGFDALQTGDIVAVTAGEKHYVHRIIEINAGYAVTMGDNNLDPDEELLTPESRFMLAVGAVARNGEFRKISGGAEGMREFRRHQKLQRRRYRAGRILEKLERVFFWRVKPDSVVCYGGEKCYFYRGNAVARRNIRNKLIYTSWKKRLLFYIPQEWKDE
jgi:hypothetical protein